MLSPIYTNTFSRDIKRAKKRRKDMSKIKKVMEMLVKDEPLPKKYREHRLIGQYMHRLECHIEPDWLLIYKKGSKQIIFERTGTHADLF